MNNKSINTQRGAVLFVALIMLLIITVLGVSSLSNSSLESRIVTNRQITQDLIYAADAGVREGEFRFYGLGYVREKLEPLVENCTENNRLKNYNKPCLIAVKELSNDDDDGLINFVKKPLQISDTDSADSWSGNLWMPYRGLDKTADTENKEGINAQWHAIRISSGEEVNESINPEYGDVAAGKGTFFYLVNGKSESTEQDSRPVDKQSKIAVQSTIAVILDGINN